MFLKEVCYAHKLHLIYKNGNIVKYSYKLKQLFNFNILSNLIYSCDGKAEFFSIHSGLQCPDPSEIILILYKSTKSYPNIWVCVCVCVHFVTIEDICINDIGITREADLWRHCPMSPFFKML